MAKALNTLIVKLSIGQLEGKRLGGCSAWLGIPFAEPPVGPLRQRAPRPIKSWNGIREARTFGPACPQSIGPSVNVAGPEYDEDCLYLNVWSPEADGKKRPVLVWIYGGAFLAGRANLYDGEHLAKLGEMVVVTFNYRLGPLGFVNFGSLQGAEELESNLGLRDQIEALRWVREHIAAFGGDPDRVTIAGESAGAVSTALLMVCQAAQGLFRAAILQSGGPGLIHDREMSEHVASLFAHELELGSDVASKLATIPPRRLLQAQKAVHKQIEGQLPASPWFDGDLLPESLDAARTAPTAEIPILAGWNRDEIRLFEILPVRRFLPMTRGQVSALLRDQFGENRAAAILAAYPATKTGDRELATDATFGMTTRHVAERQAKLRPTWLYRFDAKNPLIGAAHALEVTYLWNLTGWQFALARGGPLLGRRGALAERIQRRWIRFVRDGHPGEDWPGLEENSSPVMIFDLEDGVVSDLEEARRLAWAGLDLGLGAMPGRTGTITS